MVFSVTFSGCGFLGMYHIGAASCLKTYAPYLIQNKICGSSVGAVTACCLICDVPLDLITRHTLDTLRHARSRALGPFSPSVNISEYLYAVLKKVLLASAFIPVFSGFVPPLLGKYRYMDGGFSNNVPVLNKNTITISPFSGLADICPRDNHIQKNLVNISNNSFEITKTNCFRAAGMLFPHDPATIAELCSQGFNDALSFLQRNNLINCEVCLIRRCTFKSLSKNNIDEMAGYDPLCIECKLNNAHAKLQGMPCSVTCMLDKCIKSHNTIINDIFKCKGMKLVRFFTLPFIIAADLLHGFIRTAVCFSTKVLQDSVSNLSKFTTSYLLNFIDICSRKGEDFVCKVLSYILIENQGYDHYSPFYCYYHESHEDIVWIKYSKNTLEYVNEHYLTTSLTKMQLS